MMFRFRDEKSQNESLHGYLSVLMMKNMCGYG